MFCRTCGNGISEKAIMCVLCGTPPLAGFIYCYNCKSETFVNSSMCMKCGVGLSTQSTNKISSNLVGKDHLTTLLLCLFLGGIGVHRFYTKHTAIGTIQLLTLGCCGVWTFIDFIQIISDNYKDADENYLVHRH